MDREFGFIFESDMRANKISKITVPSLFQFKQVTVLLQTLITNIHI